VASPVSVGVGNCLDRIFVIGIGNFVQVIPRLNPWIILPVLLEPIAPFSRRRDYGLLYTGSIPPLYLGRPGFHLFQAAQALF